ncbi:MAG: tRNA (adenosine(37)-N6)-dimethylallyltransferase MiaA [Alicyclobacillus herbarius]|uniref:tRNA (adenosine(37)-N6)-dimethylallyltransferase MiaA n=1 Tax=Alicyclobacillus herbarius TaxID=122960 RepID=UPI000418D69D|nr:tRNA (adenosine(37)-N6)-dimethylallyltransferase MiaA [Alicyclobacillus herbarius]MCL6634124.1 tRNA (adenosine(37)-N6)-dimethylallyltransferase MiaA [Alicyclobacillus herbarius]
MERRWPVLCIVGPTATGKSDLAVRVAREVDGEVVSADSMQVYRHMDVGTAKLTREEMQGVPHHLIDVVNPDEVFTVAEWKQRAERAIVEILERGRLPLLVGGTGLYIRAITDDLNFAERDETGRIREKWQRYLEEHGQEALYAVLQERDEDTAARLHPNDTRRVIRALEVSETRERPWSETYDFRVREGRFETVQFGLTMTREVLYRRVEARVDKMLEQGLVAEVKKLLEHGLRPDLTSLQAIGYKELVAFLRGDLSYEEAVAQIKRNTRRFVKRQLSWFRRDPRVIWLRVAADGSLADEDYDRVVAAAKRLAAGIRGSDLE